MSKREYFVETHRPFKVSHQLLCITSIDFKTKSLVGFTELQIVSQVDSLPIIRLNCQQCSIQSIFINEYKCTFTYSDPTQDILATTEKKGPRKLDTFSTAHYDVVKTTDSDVGNGELNIEVPDLADIKNAVLEHKPLHLFISYMVENPTGGLYFAVNNQSNQFSTSNESQAAAAVDKDNVPAAPEEDTFVPHMFTTGRSNNSRLWFPCVDSFSESCTWSILVTVDDAYTAIASGELAEVEHNVERAKKRFTFSLQVPTSAPNIGLVVGPFVPVVHPHMHEVISFAFPALKAHLLPTCEQTHKIFMHYEEVLNTRYPYATYKQVFVDNMVSKYEAYATLSLININLLHSRHVIEQTYITRRVLAQAIAEQYFGSFISMQTTADGWLTRGISSYLAYDYYRKAFGNNEYRYYVKKAMDKVIKYEQLFRPIVLDPSAKSYVEEDYFHVKSFHTFSPTYDKMHKVKSFLIMRMLEIYLGKTLLLQVFNKMLSLAQLAAPQKFATNSWYNLHTSTASFIWAISTVTGKNIDTFLKQWVFQGGHVKFSGSFIFNRKRNTVELEITQKHTIYKGVRKYLGPLMIWLQELDGTFKHTLQIEDNLSKHDITCHSKSRRNKKKKIPLCTGEEIDMDLSGMDMDSPVLWLRIDPEMTLLREVILEQPDYQWNYQLRYERDVIAQIESLAVLDRFSTKHAKDALLEVILSEHSYYRVRCQATYCLRRVANSMGASWTGPPALLPQFRKLFGSPSCPNIVRMNNFSNFQHYFLQMAIFKAMAGLRTVHGICPGDVLRFLLDLFKYNDNSKNRFTDAYYRAALVDALAETVTPVAIAPIFSSAAVVDMLSADTKSILEEITRSFNLDKLLPCYKNVVTISCLRAIRHLQKMGHLPSSGVIFRAHTSHNCFVEVRKAAIQILVDIVKAEGRKEDLDFLLDDLVLGDPQPVIKFYTLKYLIKNPPFKFEAEEQSPLDTEELVERLWTLMNGAFATDSRLRCAVVDLYQVLYGRGRPRCLPKPEFSFILNIGKEKKPSTGGDGGESNQLTTEAPDEPIDLEVKPTRPTSDVLESLKDIVSPALTSSLAAVAEIKMKDEKSFDMFTSGGNDLPTAVPTPTGPKLSSVDRIFEEHAASLENQKKTFNFPGEPSFVLSEKFSAETPPLRLTVTDQTKTSSSTTVEPLKVLERPVKSSSLVHDDDIDSSPDSESDEEGQIKEHVFRPSAGGVHSPLSIAHREDELPSSGTLTTNLTLCIKKSIEGQLGSEYSTSSSSAVKKKKKKEDREKEKMMAGGEGGSSSSKHKDKKHHKEKKKKKNKHKEHKHKNKHKHKEHSSGDQAF